MRPEKHRDAKGRLQDLPDRTPAYRSWDESGELRSERHYQAGKLQGDKMRFSLVAIDQTKDWDSEIIKETGHIWTVYMYNPNEHTCCCEIAPSFFLIPLYYITERGYNEIPGVIDKVEEQMANERPHYYHCSDIQAIPKYSDNYKMALKYSTAGFEDQDEAEEYYQGNHCL